MRRTGAKPRHNFEKAGKEAACVARRRRKARGTRGGGMGWAWNGRREHSRRAASGLWRGRRTRGHVGSRWSARELARGAEFGRATIWREGRAALGGAKAALGRGSYGGVMNRRFEVLECVETSLPFVRVPGEMMWELLEYISWHRVLTRYDYRDHPLHRVLPVPGSRHGENGCWTIGRVPGKSGIAAGRGAAPRWPERRADSARGFLRTPP